MRAALVFLLLWAVQVLDSGAQTHVFVCLDCNNSSSGPNGPFTGTNQFVGPFQLGQPTNQIIFNGFGANTYTLNATAPGASRTLTLADPGASDSFAWLAATQAFTNKTYNGLTITSTTGTLTIAGGKTTVFSNGLTFTGTDGTSFAFPSTSDTVVTLGATQTLTNKTLTSPVLTTPNLGVATATSINGLTITASTGTLTIANAKVLTASNTLTFAGVDGKTLTLNNNLTLAGTDATTLTFQGTDTYVGRATADVLTNKTFDTAGTGNVFKINGIQITAVQGSGAAVLANSPTLTTPNIGVATASSLAVNHTQSNSPTSPTCTFVSGGGTSPSCTVDTGSSDVSGQIRLITGTGSPAASGTATLTLAVASPHFPMCTVNLSENGIGQWNARASVMYTTGTTVAFTMQWDNNAVSLSTSTAYAVIYTCSGI